MVSNAAFGAADSGLSGQALEAWLDGLWNADFQIDNAISTSGDVGKVSAFALRGCGASVWISEIDPICALQACIEDFQVTTMEACVSQVDILVLCNGNFIFITSTHTAMMKNNAIVGNMGHFDNDIDMAGLAGGMGMKIENT